MKQKKSVSRYFFFCRTGDIWQKFYRNGPWVVPYVAYKFCPNRGNQNIKFAKKYSRIFSSEAIMGTEPNIQVIFISLASTKILFLVAIARVLSSL